MPKKKRKYPSRKKTTTPEGKTEYQRLQMKARRQQKRKLKEQARTELFSLSWKEMVLVKQKLPSVAKIILGKDLDRIGKDEKTKKIKITKPPAPRISKPSIHLAGVPKKRKRK